jgi:hypothetical protein
MHGYLFGSPPPHDGVALDSLEQILVELLRLRGFEGGTLHTEVLTLEEVAARDGALPLFLAQAAAWADLMGVPQVVSAFDLTADDGTLTHMRAVLSVPEEDAGVTVIGAPLLLFLNYAVHLARSASSSNRLALENLTHPPQPEVCHALSVRSWPTPRAS